MICQGFFRFYNHQTMVITKDKCFYLGYISKTQGFKGGVIAFFDVDNTQSYQKLQRLLIDLNGSLTPFFIETLNLKDKGFVHLKLEGVDNHDRSKAISNQDIYLPLTDLPTLPTDEFYFHDLVNMMVHDKTLGEIGPVDKVLDFNRNPLMQITRAGNEILIPISDQFIAKVDKSEKIVHVDLPEGLIEINQS